METSVVVLKFTTGQTDNNIKPVTKFTACTEWIGCKNKRILSAPFGRGNVM